MGNDNLYGLQTTKRDSLHNYAYRTDLDLPNRKVDDAKRQMGSVQRFWARVRKQADGCWIYDAPPANKAGHAHIVTNKKIRVYVHRFSYWLHNGPIPDGQSVLHRCDVPRCVNPAHLFLGSQKENMRDAVRKGRKKAWGIQKLDALQVQQIRALAAAGELHKDIAPRFGIARNTVTNIVNRKSWGHLA